MPAFSVYDLISGDEEPTTYAAESLADLVDQVLDEWVGGDRDLPGIMAFLRANGVEPPMEDDDVIEGENEPEIIEAADAVRAIVETSPARATEFLAAISGAIRVEEIDSSKLPPGVEKFLEGITPVALREAVRLAISVMSPRELVFMDVSELAHILTIVRETKSAAMWEALSTGMEEDEDEEDE